MMAEKRPTPTLSGRILFITGTDTGVGKTLLTVWLLMALRRSGIRALAMKPFCSGGWNDVQAIQRVQGDWPAREALTPYYFPDPLAPLAAARRQGRVIRPQTVMAAISKLAVQCDRLLVEGAGGVLVPLGKDFCVADLIARLRCDVVVVSTNKLGVINHTRLTVEALRARGVKRMVIVLMERADQADQADQDLSARSNAALLRELVGQPVISFPWLPESYREPGGKEREMKKIKKVLARITDPGSFCPRRSELPSERSRAERLKTKKDR